MIDVKRGIKVKDFMALLKPFEEMELTFSKTNNEIGKSYDCYCGINLVGNNEDIKLEIEIDK